MLINLQIVESKTVFVFPSVTSIGKSILMALTLKFPLLLLFQKKKY